MNFLLAVALIAFFLLLVAALFPSSPCMPHSSPSLPPSSPSLPHFSQSLSLSSPTLPPSTPTTFPPTPVLPLPPPVVSPPVPPLPPASSPPVCSDDLLAFSSCLSFVSAPPNDLTDAPTPSCCAAFSAVFNSTERDCYCYLIKQPSLFGFPLNESRLLSLPQICNPASLSLDSVCSVSTMAALPPLRNARDPPPIDSDFTLLPPAETISPEELTPPPPPSPLANPSSALKKMSSSYRLLASGAVTFLGVLCAR